MRAASCGPLLPLQGWLLFLWTRKNVLASREEKLNCTTKEVQTDLSRKWSSTVNKELQCFHYKTTATTSLLSVSSVYLLLDNTDWFVAMVCFWTLLVVHSWSFCHFSCFVCRHFPLFWDKLFKTYLSGFLTERSQGAVMLLVGFTSESSLEKKNKKNNLAEFLQLSVKSCEICCFCLHTETSTEKGDVTVVRWSWVLAKLSSWSQGEFRTFWTNRRLYLLWSQVHYLAGKEVNVDAETDSEPTSTDVMGNLTSGARWRHYIMGTHKDLSQSWSQVRRRKTKKNTPIVLSVADRKWQRQMEMTSLCGGTM